MLALWLLASAAAVFEVSGEVTPATRAVVMLHSASSPFTVRVFSDSHGRYRFARIPTGAYTLTAYVPSAGEVRRTIEVGPGTADQKRRVVVSLRLDDIERTGAGTVSTRDLSIPDKARREFVKANELLAKNDVRAAIAHLERATGIAPQFSAAWNQLGTIAYQTQKFHMAEQHFRRALKENPDDYSPLVNLGGVLLNLGQLDEAWKYNVDAVLKRPADPLANSQLGMTYLALNKYELAEKYLLEASRLDPAHFSHPQLQLAEVYLRRKEPLRAADQLEDFLRYHPDYSRAAAMRRVIAKLRR